MWGKRVAGKKSIKKKEIRGQNTQNPTEYRASNGRQSLQGTRTKKSVKQNFKTQQLDTEVPWESASV